MPRRIVSLDLCADQLVVALADRGQIAGLTEWSRDPRLSSVAAAAGSLPITHRSAEEVMALHPDLVIGAPYRTRAALGQLQARGLRLIEMPQAESLDGIARAIMTIATAIGHPDRGRSTIARMRGELSLVGTPPGRGRVAAYYQRHGYLTGTGTLVDEMFHRVGLVNLAARRGRSALSQISLEEMALARPDFLVMDDGTQRGGDLAAAALNHRVLDHAVPRDHRLYIPEALTTCGGPGYPRAVALLARQIRAADARPGSPSSAIRRSRVPAPSFPASARDTYP